MKDTDTNHIERIHMQLSQARVRQRRLYILAGFSLLVGVFFILGMIAFSNGTVIDVHPADARNTAVVKVLSSLGASVGNTVYSLQSRPDIEISATGFRSLQKTLLPSETGGHVSIELSELPGRLHLSTTPNSNKTRWSIDGQTLAVGKTFEKELPAGSYDIEIDHPYYRKNKISIVIERGKALEQNIALEPVSGQMSITTTPAGANLSINGKPAGVSPLSLTRTGGRYRLKVEHSDYQTISEDIDITNADPVVERNYRLALKKSFVHISLSPAGGVLLLNGKQVHLSSAEKLAVQARINNTLSYLKNGYFPQHKNIMVEPGLETKVSLHLKPEIGVINIRSKPKASVVVDGKQRGQTPLVIKLSAIPHRIELHKKGYRPYKKTITPSSQSAQKIRAVLRTELQARLIESPGELNNAAGITLKLFKPNDTFVMGAPRHEKGQRANEFLRTVKLVRAFYIGTQEVTNAQYAGFRQRPGARNEPVTSISWIEAAEYCNWLSQREKLTPFYDIRNHRLYGFHATSDGYRLPTEAEWEWLARKAAKQQQSRFTWGDDTTIPPNSGNIADEYAKGNSTRYVPNYSDGYAGVAPVGSYPPETSGLYDLTGNVSEWVHDVYSLLPPDEQTTEIDPLGAHTGDTHTVKGSNWRSGTITELRASFREGAKAGRDDIGFRVARYVYGGIHAKK